MRAATDRFADVTTGYPGFLTSGPNGAARILWAESGTGQRRALVLTAALLAEIDAAIAAGEMAPWPQLGRDRQTVAALLATHCQNCPKLSQAGCERVPWPCKRWSIWRQTVLVGWCERWGERAADSLRAE
jgi:hypothetical protein